MDLIEPPFLPKRTLLYRLPPLGVRTAGSEGLYSWFLRIAERHCLKPNDLIRYLGKTCIDEETSELVWSRHLHDANWAFTGDHTRTWVRVLEEQTGCHDLRLLTLLPYATALPILGRGQMRRRWCPHCLNERKAQGQAYTSLAWEIGLVTACPEHRDALVEVCPHCGSGAEKRAGRNLAYYSPGHCGHCGGWLGDAEAAPADQEAVALARLVGNWIAAMPQIPDNAQLSVAPVLEAAAASYAKGRPAVLAKALGFPKTTLHGWIKGTSIPSLSHACDLAMRLGVSLSDLYLGNKAALPDQPLLMLDGPKQKRPRMRIDWPAVDQQLQGYLRVAEPVSVRQIAAELGVSRRTLYSHDEILMKRLAARYDAWQLRHQEGIASERLEIIHGLLDACDDEDLVLPGRVRKAFERLGHSMSWWGFGRLYQTALNGREAKIPGKE